MKRIRIKAKDFARELEAGGYSYSVTKKDAVEKLVDKEAGLRLVSINGKVSFFYDSERLIPTLKLLQIDVTLLPAVVVDMGAIKFVVGGADIMRPGIVNINSSISSGTVVAIVDETHGKAIAVGELMYSSEEVLAMEKGKVVKNIHYVGDDIWNV